MYSAYGYLIAILMVATAVLMAGYLIITSIVLPMIEKYQAMLSVAAGL